LNILQNYVIPQFAGDRDILFQQDGAYPHFGIIVRQSLERNFSEWWLVRGESIGWPSCSPDLTPLDFLCRNM